MSVFCRPRIAAFLAAAALAPLAQAQAAPGCASAGAGALTLGTVADVAPGSARTYAIRLETGQGVIVDLASLKPKPAAQSAAGDEEGDEHDHEHGSDGAKTPPTAQCQTVRQRRRAACTRSRVKCSKRAAASRRPTTANACASSRAAAARTSIAVSASDEPRELLVRRRLVGAAPPPLVSARLDTTQKGTVSSTAPVVFTFDGAAGQWVELKSTSEKDTVLRLAGPDRQGNYSILAENDDSDGLNPLLRRKLPLAGTYYLQVDSLAEEAGDFELALKRTGAPKPPPPPATLRLGAATTDKLKDGDDVRLYALPVIAGHSYRLELNAAYDGVVAIGLPNPVETDSDPGKPDASFSEVKSQDSGTTGTERLNFTARSSGQLLVRIKSFGIKETDGSYTLTATDQGG